MKKIVKSYKKTSGTVYIDFNYSVICEINVVVCIVLYIYC